MKNIIKTFLLIVGTLAVTGASEAVKVDDLELRVELNDGSIFFTRDISTGENETKKIETNYGSLLIPEKEIQLIRYPYEKNILYESWRIQTIEGKANATLLLALPESDSEDLLLPFIESSYEPIISKVLTLENEVVNFEQVDRGPIVFIRLKKKDVPKKANFLLVEISTASALKVLEDGTMTFQRRFTPDNAGIATFSLQVADDLRIKHNQSLTIEHTENKYLRRQQDWTFDVEIIRAKE